MNITTKEAIFLFDENGVIVITDIVGEKVMRAEFVYDGKNCALLRRDNETYALHNIAPLIREKIKDGNYVTLVEKNGDDIRSYDVRVRMVDDLGIEDNWDTYADQTIKKLKQTLTKEEFEKFMTASEKMLQELEK